MPLGVRSVTEDIEPLLTAAGCYARRDEFIRKLVPDFGAGWGCKVAIANVLGNEGYSITSLVVQSPDQRLQKLRLPLEAINELITQSGLSIGFVRLAAFAVFGALVIFAFELSMRDGMLEAAAVALAATVVLPYLALRLLRARRQKKFGLQFPDAIDVIVRSLRAGHPVPVAISMVAREFTDPVGTEFGIVADEITYGADLETAMRNLYFRVGQDDLPLFVTAVAIQGTTGGNLGEILENLSGVIRQRFKMRRKVRALAAEGRASALILSALPIGMFAIVQVVAPDFYGSVWHYDLTHFILACAVAWMMVGNFIMYRMVNFKI